MAIVVMVVDERRKDALRREERQLAVRDVLDRSRDEVR
jgi:hypothetical protein